MWVCRKCKSNNVQQRAWVDLNTERIVDYIDDGSVENYYCEDCDEHQYVEQREDAQIVGYQVVRSTINGIDIHPEMEASFCVLPSLEQANMLLMDTPTAGYFIQTIYKGDIEDPSFIGLDR